MAGLYQRLFTYRQRPDRSPLEDFLTEALADLLNRLPDSIARAVVERLLHTSPNAWFELAPYWTDAAHIHWSTQRAITDNRRLDLLMEIDQRPMLVIENKIGAGFQDYGEDRDDAAGLSKRGQLASYGHWLAAETVQTWGGGLVLLTHWTPAPLDFSTAEEAYGCRHRTTFKWTDFSRLLARTLRSSEGDVDEWVFFGRELLAFLREQNMDSELATGSDLAALQIYVASADRVRHSVEHIWEGAKDIWKPLCTQSPYPIEVSTQYGCVWKFRYLSRADLRRSFIATGIRYPALSQHPAYSDPEGEPYLFVELGSDDDNSPIDRLSMSEDWESYDDQRIAKLSIRELPVDPEQFVAEASKWALARFIEAAPLLA